MAAGQLLEAVCFTVWILSWAAFYRCGFENWNFKELRNRFDSAFEMDENGYNDHADEEELRNLMVRIEDASQKGYFETVADIRVIIPKIANRGNISSKFRDELKEKFNRIVTGSGITGTVEKFTAQKKSVETAPVVEDTTPTASDDDETLSYFAKLADDD